ncbi:MAG: glycoside hydrolase family 3 N-terminal domain-containing protein [bacterium]|nr:glycoside hydrolase family 3 N-terminal domain-containing protein [bacterium]
MSSRNIFFAVFASVFVLVAGIFFFMAAGSVYSPEKDTKEQEDIVKNNSFDEVSEIVSTLSLEEKIGQMFFLGIWSKDGNDKLVQLVDEGRVGGVLIMGPNVGTYDETKELISRIHDAGKKLSGLPVFVAVDQEGGIVSRLRFEGFELTAQSDIKSETQAKEVAMERARDLTGLGINLNFSPVVEHISDADSFLYKRTFRASKEETGRFSSAMVEGYQKEGIVAVPKHFPGHKDDSVDSHKLLPVAQIRQEDFLDYLEPFLRVLEENDVSMMMTAHVLFPLVDGEFPATLSEKIINEILRNEIGYDGVVITDDMEMKAIQDGFGLENSALSAIKAGNDILLYVSVPERQERVFNAVLEAVKSGDISESRIDESVKRIVKLKLELLKEKETGQRGVI